MPPIQAHIICFQLGNSIITDRMKVQAIFKGGKTAAKPATKKASAPAKSSGSKKTGGWLGSGSQNVNLDKW